MHWNQECQISQPIRLIELLQLWVCLLLLICSFWIDHFKMQITFCSITQVWVCLLLLIRSFWIDNFKMRITSCWITCCCFYQKRGGWEPVKLTDWSGFNHLINQQFDQPGWSNQLIRALLALSPLEHVQIYTNSLQHIPFLFSFCIFSCKLVYSLFGSLFSWSFITLTIYITVTGPDELDYIGRWNVAIRRTGS